MLLFSKYDKLKIILTALSAPLDALSLYLFFTVCTFAVNGDTGFQINLVNDIFEKLDIQTLIFLTGLSVLVSTILKYYANKIHIALANKIRSELSVKTFSEFLQTDYNKIVKKHSSDLPKRVISDVDELVKYYILPFIKIPYYCVSVLSIGVVALILNPFVILISFIVLLVIYSLIILTNKLEIISLSSERNKSNEGRFFVLQEMNTLIKWVKFEKLENNFLKEFSNYSLNLSSTTARIDVLASRPKFYMEGILFIGVLTLIFFFNDKSMLVEAVLVVSLTAIKLIPSLQALYQSVTNMSYGKGILKKIHIPNIEESFDDSDNTPHIGSEIDALSVQNIWFAYEPGNYVLNGWSKIFKTGALYGICGESGSGKSTIVDIILGLLRPDEGSISFITIDGVNHCYPLDHFNSLISYCPQNVHLESGTVAHNIAGDNKIDPNRIRESMNAIGLNDIPLDFDVGEDGNKLSGGQRQRIGVLRALYSNRKIIVLDEATSALDTENEDRVIKMLKKLTGSIVIIVSHSSNVINQCSTIIHLDN